MAARKRKTAKTTTSTKARSKSRSPSNSPRSTRAGTLRAAKGKGSVELPGEGQGAVRGWDFLLGFPKFKSPQEVFRALVDSELEALLGENSIVRACVNKIVVTSWEAPPEVGRVKDDGSFEVVENHSVAELLKNPNDDMTWKMYQQVVIQALKLTGQSFSIKVRENGFVTKLIPVPTSWVTILFDDRGFIVGYRLFARTGRPKNFLPSDILRIWCPDPSAPMRALGELESATRDIQIEQEREAYLTTMLANTPVAGGVLKTQEDISKEMRDEIRALVKERAGGHRRGDPMILEGGAEWEQKEPLSDLDWPGVSSLGETRIPAALGVPPILIGVRAGLDRSTLANLEGSEKLFVRGTMVPLWLVLDEAFTKALLTNELEEDETLVVRHRTDDVAELQEDKNAVREQAREDVKAGLITVNEGRGSGGWDNLPNGDVFLRPLNVIEVRAEDVGNQPDVPEQTPEEEQEGAAAAEVTEEGEDSPEPTETPVEAPEAEGASQKPKSNGNGQHAKPTPASATHNRLSGAAE